MQSRDKRARGKSKAHVPRIIKTTASSLRGVPLSRMEPGTMAYARVPYTTPDPGGATSKTRPVVIVRRAGRTVWVSPITTKPRGGTPIDLSGTGLSRRSFLRLDLVELDKMDILDLIGEIGQDEWATLSDRFSTDSSD